MVTEVAVHTPSRMRSMTSTRDGHWLFQAEGGVMTFIDTYVGGAYSQSGFDSEVKSVRVGARGVLANRMILDPAASNAPDEGNANDLLYIAGGRDGLWMMEADIKKGYETNRAWRVDDSGNINNNIQNSQRWCSDVDVMTVAGVDYLLALFSRKDQSRLRAYKLVDVRLIWNSPNELGNELTATKQVNLNTHPSPALVPIQPHYGRSVALSMTVDQSGDTGAEVADVYVAMAHHGIVRVRFSGNPLTKQRTWGPVFGSGTPYGVNPNTLIPSDKSPALYKDYEYELARDFHETRVVERQEAPVFTDVAVYRDDPTDPSIYHLYATVDHLFWVCFDLKNQTFCPSMPILHHEGVEVNVPSSIPNGPVMKIVKPAALNQGKGGAARSLEIVEHSGVPYLVVTANMRSFLKDYRLTTTEGIGYEHSFGWGGGWALGTPSKTQLFWYQIQASYTPASFNDVGHVEFGGEHLHLPQLQELSTELKIFHNTTTLTSGQGPKPGVCLTLVSLNSSASQSFIREENDAEGRYTFNAVSSLNDPNLVLTAKNDGFTPRDGFLAMGKDGAGTWQVENYYSPDNNDPNDPSDDRGADSVILGPGGQWRDFLQEVDHQFLWTGGDTKNKDNFDDFGAGRWLLLDLFVPADTLTQSPDRAGAWYFIPPEDTFGNRGRQAFQTGTMNRDFDAFLDALGGDAERHLFGARQKTAEGLTVLDRALTLDLTNDLNNGDDIDLKGANAGAINLVTHPEFNNMPRSDPFLRSWWGGVGLSDHQALIFNWAPIMVNVKNRISGEFDSWVLVAPCGWISANADWDVYELPADAHHNPDWFPDAGIWTNNYTSGLIQFWEMAPPDGDPTGPYTPVTIQHEGIEKNSPLRKIVGQPRGNFWKLDSIRIGDEVFLIAADFGGRVSIYEISGVLSWDNVANPDGIADSSVLVAEWETPGSLFDDLTTPVLEIAVDYRGGTKALIYVAAHRAGVRILELDAGANPTTLTQLTSWIQAPAYAVGVHVRVNDDGSRNLVVSNYGAGIHVYE